MRETKESIQIELDKRSIDNAICSLESARNYLSKAISEVTRNAYNEAKCAIAERMIEVALEELGRVAEELKAQENAYIMAQMKKEGE